MVAIVRLVATQSASRAASAPGSLGADDPAVAVEGVEVGRGRHRVGAQAVRRAALGGDRDLAGQLEQPPDQRPLGSARRPPRAPRRARPRRRSRASRAGDALVGRLAQDARDPRVRVLDVVDRVVLRGRAGELEVDVDRRVVAALEHEEARRVDADVVDQLVEGDEVAAALAHPPALAALDDADQLHDRRLEAIRVDAERRERRPHPRHVAVVVGAEHVDQPLVPALELVEVVGDVGGEVGRLAVGADQDAVLVVAELGRAQPDRALAARRRARAPRSSSSARSTAPDSRRRALRRPGVVVGRRSAPGSPRSARASPRSPAASSASRSSGSTPARRELGRPARRRTRPRSRPRAARSPRIRAAIDSANSSHLGAGVVEVVLALDLVAGALEQPRQRVAVGGAAAAGGGHRPGRVGAHELDQDPLGRSRGRPPSRSPAASSAAVASRCQRSERKTLRKPGPATSIRSALVAEDPLELVAQPLGDLARRRAGGRREQHRGVGRVVAELGLRRALEAQLLAGVALERRRSRRSTRRAQLGERVGCRASAATHRY